MPRNAFTLPTPPPRRTTPSRLARTLGLAAGGVPPIFPVGATIDLQGRLPPPQQTLLTPTIIVTIVLIGVAIMVIVFMSIRARRRAGREAYKDALRMAEKIMLKRGGSIEDVDKVLYIFKANPRLDPAAIVMIRSRFQDDMRPILDKAFGQSYGERIDKIFFPPPKDTRRAMAGQAKDVKSLVDEQKSAVSSSQTAGAMLDLMDATLKPGSLCRLAFEGIEGGYESMVMGHDLNAINLTLPAHNDNLVASIHTGMRVEGMLESGPSLLAFTATVLQAVAGSMPYCRISPWKSAWEVRKRDSVRLPISLEIDFQHISTANSETIKMTSLDKEIGAIRPGRLTDISLGGCRIDTPSDVPFRVGDMLRFSKSLVTGNPPATLLGAIVNVATLDPETNEGCRQSLHIQFLVIDDVSQRILVRTLRQLQDIADRDEWIKAQQLMQKMRRNKIQNIGSPSATSINRRDSTSIHRRDSTSITRNPNHTQAGAARPPTGIRPAVPPARPPTGQHPNPAGTRPPTASRPAVPPRPSTRRYPPQS